MLKNEHVYWAILALKLVQNVLDEILDYFFGFKTASGWKKERERAIYDYETSAQVVSIGATVHLATPLKIDSSFGSQILTQQPKF